MNYKVLLVDDEPIILSGIKSLIDWGENDCEIIGTCRNGEQAFEAIAQMQPEIVICDINMPVMDGITLLEKTRDEYPHVVFVMLTNLEDFELARKALQFQAVDYVVKSQLEPSALEQSLSVAKIASDNRTKLIKNEVHEYYSKTADNAMVREVLNPFFSTEFPKAYEQTAVLLKERNMFSSFSALYIALDYTEVSTFNDFTEQEETRLFSWQQDIIEQIAQKFFTKFVCFPFDASNDDFVVFCWDVVPQNWQNQALDFSKRLLNGGMNVTQIKTSVFSTECFADRRELVDCREQVRSLKRYHYNTASEYAYVGEIAQKECEDVKRQQIIDQVITKLKSKDFRAAEAIVENMLNTLETSFHKPIDGVTLCKNIYGAFCEFLPDSQKSKNEASVFFDSAKTQREISHLSTKTRLIQWLKGFLIEIEEQFGAVSSKTDIFESVCLYVNQNVQKRITLQDVAQSVSISPNYLSAQFKKHYGKNLVDYINETKINRAVEMIKENKLLMYQISDALAFENPYYFTKVFKKYKGITPTEYQKNL